MTHIEDYGDKHDIVGKSIISGLREFYLSEILCDATIVTADKRFLCHKVVLSSISPYFRALFVCPMKESASGEVSLLDIPSSVVQVILHFIYTGEVTFSIDNVVELFTVSSRLQIEPLQDLCSRFLMKNTDSENCLWIYRLALSHNDQSLLDVTMHYISQHVTTLSEKEAFSDLELSELTRILSSDQLMVSSEFTIYNIVCQWWEFQFDKGSPLPEELTQVVRFPLMIPNELKEVNIDIPSENQTQTFTEFHLRQGMFEDRILCMDVLERDDVIPEEDDYHINSYDPITDSWEKLPFINPTYGSGLIAVGNMLYVSGGQADDLSVSNLLHAYDSIKNEWKELPSMAIPRHGHGLLHYRQVLYVFGGCLNREIISSAECFNLVENSWSACSSLLVPLHNFTSAQFKERLFLIGGETVSGSVRIDYQGFLIYDIPSDTWSKVYLPVKLLAVTAVALDEMLYVFARYGYKRRECQAYPPCDDNRPYQLLREQLNISRSFCVDDMGRICHSKIPPILENLDLSAVVVWKDRIYIMGGNDRDSSLPDQMFYWSSGEPKWTKCDKDIPFLVDGGIGAVTMQVPMKRFYSLIPGRRSSYNFRYAEYDE
ncbi:kelch-like protein 24 [Eleutherodactylus coqui]|uniref:kelch-like protein 24 n=1 Tax=Eleutherodactylus coqui TaxID=57060 RepID=UPI003462F8E4